MAAGAPLYFSGSSVIGSMASVIVHHYMETEEYRMLTIQTMKKAEIELDRIQASQFFLSLSLRGL